MHSLILALFVLAPPEKAATNELLPPLHLQAAGKHFAACQQRIWGSSYDPERLMIA